MAASEIGSFQNGLFVPGNGGWDFQKFTVTKEIHRGELTPRESRLFKALSSKEAENPYAKLIDKATAIIVAEELGVDVVSPDPEKKALQRFFINTISAADTRFDSNREAFIEAREQGAETFLTELHRVPIVSGDEEFSVGEALEVFDAQISNPSLYPVDAQTLLRNTLQVLTTRGIQDAARKDELGLSGDETQRIKETSNGLYTGMLFDILYAPHMGRKGYTPARERYIATRLAWQYGDDVLDVNNDLGEGSANLVVARASDLEELDSLVSSGNGTVYASPLATVLAVRDAAPQAYGIIADRQHELLTTAALPKEITRNLNLPK